MSTTSKLIGLVRFESTLAVVLIAVPIALRLADDRDSISAYHDMADPRWFFVPLTAASMMLITNGLVTHERHGHNATLGVLLLGVVMFDHDGGSRWPHGISAIAFYVLALSFAVLMVTHYVGVRTASEPSRRVAGVSALVVGGTLALVWVVVEPPLFWVEAVGIWFIALHHLFHSFWKARRPHDHTEPAAVLEQILPRFHRFVAVLISPLTRSWRWLNTERRAGAAELVRDAPTDPSG